MSIASPIVAIRRRVYEDCTPETRQVISQMQDAFSRMAAGNMQIWWDIGAILENVYQHPDEFGGRHRPLRLIAEYNGLDRKMILGLRKLATRLTRDEVVRGSREARVDGVHLAVEHWLAIAAVNEPEDRKALLAKVISKCLSPLETRREAADLLAARRDHESTEDDTGSWGEWSEW